jgi:inosine-uridine nucleoside N-ribohydrolase
MKLIIDTDIGDDFDDIVTLAVALDELKRQLIFTRTTPILFDVAALAFAIEPAMFRVERLRLAVDAEGYTREADGPPNAEVCLEVDENRFHRWLMPRLAGRPGRG